MAVEGRGGGEGEGGGTRNFAQRERVGIELPIDTFFSGLVAALLRLHTCRMSKVGS